MKLNRARETGNKKVSKEDEQSNIPFEQIAMYLIWIGIAIIVVISLGYVLYKNDLIQYAGDYGQFVGGLTGSVWALAGVMLFYEALKYQRSEMKLQRHELELQRFVQIQQNDLFKQQNQLVEVQTFEGTLFNLVNLLNQIVDNVELEVRDINKEGKSVVNKITGRDCFYDYYNLYKRIFNYSFENIHYDNFNPDSLKQVVEYSFRLFYEEHQTILGHYFRTLSNLLRFIDKVVIKNKPFYMELILSQLSNYELAMLHFIGLSEKFKDLKSMIENFNLLGDVPNDELIELTRELYDEKAFQKIK